MTTQRRTLLGLACLASLLLGAVPASPGGGPLEPLTQKQIAKAEHRLQKLEAREAKQQAKVDALDAAHGATALALSDAQAALDAAVDALADAQDALDAALALPQETPAESAARAAAVKAAKAQLAAAIKAHNLAQKALAQTTQKLAKLAAKLVKRGAKLDATSAKIEQLEAELVVLASDFGWQSTQLVSLSGVVRDGFGAPLAGAQLSVVDTLAPPKKTQQIEQFLSPALYWQGVSQPDGSFVGELELPLGHEQVDLIVVLAGYEGDYTHAALRELWGPFAPAARVAQAVGALAELDVVLTELAP